MTIKAVSASVYSRKAMTICGPCYLSVLYAGDMWEVVTECEDEQGRENTTSEFFSSLSAARRYVDEY